MLDGILSLRLFLLPFKKCLIIQVTQNTLCMLKIVLVKTQVALVLLLFMLQYMVLHHSLSYKMHVSRTFLHLHGTPGI